PAERVQVAGSHLWPRLLRAYNLPTRTVPLPPDALELVVTGYAGAEEAGLRGVETRMEALLNRAIAQGRPNPAGVDHPGVRRGAARPEVSGAAGGGVRPSAIRSGARGRRSCVGGLVRAADPPTSAVTHSSTGGWVLSGSSACPGAATNSLVR
ncbi:hypothetical protein B1A_12902, partial [mine drainage metagenome]